jgi:hypothetical protein
MNEVTTLDPIVIARFVYLRRDALAGQYPLAEFSSFRIACIAVRLLRKADWLRAGELMLDDEDFLTLQVLHRRMVKLNASYVSGCAPSRDHRGGEPEKGKFTRAKPFEGTLDDLF